MPISIVPGQINNIFNSIAIFEKSHPPANNVIYWNSNDEPCEGPETFYTDRRYFNNHLKYSQNKGGFGRGRGQDKRNYYLRGGNRFNIQ